jgi:hypothetical protein
METGERNRNVPDCKANLAILLFAQTLCGGVIQWDDDGFGRIGWNQGNAFGRMLLIL